MSDTEKKPSDMSISEIQKEIEDCYESLNTLMKLTNQKMKLGSDIGGGIGKRIEELKEELRLRKDEEWLLDQTKDWDR